MPIEQTVARNWTFAERVPRYRPYTLRDLGAIPQLDRLPRWVRQEMQVVARVLPFRANNFVIDELIDWSQVPDDPYFRFIFPVCDMLCPEHFSRMATALTSGDTGHIQGMAEDIRAELNPHPASQMEHTVSYR